MSNKWEKAQELERKYHQEHQSYRQSEYFDRDSANLLADVEPADVVIDIGAGPKLRTKTLAKDKLIVIEPLSAEYMQDLEWCNLQDADHVYPLAAEDFIGELAGVADLVVCINMLDHCYSPVEVAENAYAYLNGSGAFILAVDLREHADDTHPITFNKKELIKMLEGVGFGLYAVDYIPPFAGEGRAAMIKAVK